MTSSVKSNILSIVTPEGVSFPLLLASPVVRGVAWTIDFAIILALFKAVDTVVTPLMVVSFDLARALDLILLFAIGICYPIAFEWLWNGCTPGKRLLGLRVMDIAGLNLSFQQVVIRNLVRVLDAAPLFYLVGGVACMTTRCFQRLGDLAAQTVVVRVVPASAPDLSCLDAHKFNSLRDYPHIAARLRKQVEPEEAALLLDALLRRTTLAPEARAEIYAELAAHFKQKAIFPQEALDGLSDERYLQNAADILYRR